jgi:LacI family transcriptional regulator
MIIVYNHHPAKNMVTMKDVAAEAGVSVFTVSSVINDSPRISPSTREKVQKAIEKLNYVPNPAARNLRTRKSGTIGVVFPYFTSNNSRAFFGSVAEGVHDALRGNGYHFLLSGISRLPGEEERELDNLVRKGIEGLIYAPVNSRNAVRTVLRFPVVVIDRSLAGFKGDCVFNNNFESSFEAVSYLVGKGHRRIGYMGRRSGYSNHRERFEGYKQALLSNGIPFDDQLVKTPPKSDLGGVAFGYSAFQALHPQKVSAIFCNESYGTIGILKYAHERKVKIPDDLALVTYDDLEWCEILDPPLTAIRQPSYEMGFKAAKLLLERLMNPDAPTRRIVLQSQLIIRAST